MRFLVLLLIITFNTGYLKADDYLRDKFILEPVEESKGFNKSLSRRLALKATFFEPYKMDYFIFTQSLIFDDNRIWSKAPKNYLTVLSGSSFYILHNEQVLLDISTLEEIFAYDLLTSQTPCIGDNGLVIFQIGLYNTGSGSSPYPDILQISFDTKTKEIQTKVSTFEESSC